MARGRDAESGERHRDTQQAEAQSPQVYGCFCLVLLELCLAGTMSLCPLLSDLKFPAEIDSWGASLSSGVMGSPQGPP